jgi:hypothetical protein
VVYDGYYRNRNFPVNPHNINFQVRNDNNQNNQNNNIQRGGDPLMEAAVIIEPLAVNNPNNNNDVPPIRLVGDVMDGNFGNQNNKFSKKTLSIFFGVVTVFSLLLGRRTKREVFFWIMAISFWFLLMINFGSMYNYISDLTDNGMNAGFI